MKSNRIEARYSGNGYTVGEFVLNDDGYYVLFWNDNGGYLDESILTDMLKQLKKLNRIWNHGIIEFFDFEERKDAWSILDEFVGIISI